MGSSPSTANAHAIGPASVSLAAAQISQQKPFISTGTLETTRLFHWEFYHSTGYRKIQLTHSTLTNSKALTINKINAGNNAENIVLYENKAKLIDAGQTLVFNIAENQLIHKVSSEADYEKLPLITLDIRENATDFTYNLYVQNDTYHDYIVKFWRRALLFRLETNITNNHEGNKEFNQGIGNSDISIVVIKEPQLVVLVRGNPIELVSSFAVDQNDYEVATVNNQSTVHSFTISQNDLVYQAELLCTKKSTIINKDIPSSKSYYEVNDYEFSINGQKLPSIVPPILEKLRESKPLLYSQTKPFSNAQSNLAQKSNPN
jgi:hypothetical protein